MQKAKLAIIVKSFRKKYKLTQSEFSKLAGVSPRTISRIEKEQGNPTLEIVSKILAVTGREEEEKEIRLLQFKGFGDIYFIDGHGDSFEFLERVLREKELIGYQEFGFAYLRSLPNGDLYISMTGGQGAMPITFVRV